MVLYITQTQPYASKAYTEDARYITASSYRLPTSSMVSRATGSGWSIRSISACTSSNSRGTSTLRTLFLFWWVCFLSEAVVSGVGGRCVDRAGW